MDEENHKKIHFLHFILFIKTLFEIPGGDDDDETEGEEEPTPSCSDYIMHFLTLFWKIIFAFIPPTGEFDTLFQL